MIEKTIFKAALNEVFQRSRFARKGQSWFLNGEDAIVVVELQKSNYDEKYYVNFGIWLKRFGLTLYPKANHCQIQSRLTSLYPDH